jgi:hypothetical protein
MNYPEPGKFYRHYKGGLYKVLHLAKHTENEEILVIYQSLHFGSFHARPLESWNTKVDNPNKEKYDKVIPRFKIENNDIY